MTSMTARINPRDIVHGLLTAAASEAPGPIGGVLKLIIDELIFPKFLDGWLFPKPDTDLFNQFKDRIQKMIEKEIEVAVGQATFDRVKARISGLADAFRGFGNVVDFDERRVRLAYLLTLADATVAEVEAVPDRYLYLLTDQLQIVAIMNIAVLIDQVKMHPGPLRAPAGAQPGCHSLLGPVRPHPRPILVVSHGPDCRRARRH